MNKMIAEMSTKAVIQHYQGLFEKLEKQEQLALIRALKEDRRKSILTFAHKLEKRYLFLEQEVKRQTLLWQYEKAHYQKGCRLVAGTDEVGRGPIAGPVVACAVILPQGIMLEGINDSKKLSAKKREALSEQIKAHALAYHIASIEADYIDKINILKASKLAMAQAVANLKMTCDMILIDGNQNIPIDLPQQTIIEGDSKSISIAAASIVAKVYRDQLMMEYAKIYPGYGFESHKGYGTKAHYECIKKLGLTPIHRRSFSLGE